MCEGTSSSEMKLLFISVCFIYFAQSIQLFDDLRRRGAKRVKMTPEASYTIMGDKLHEHVFSLMIHVTNLFIVYTIHDNVVEAMFNCLAMSFLSDLENEFQTAYYANRVEEAADVYDTVFVTHRQNARKMLTRRKSACFRCVHAGGQRRLYNGADGCTHSCPCSAPSCSALAFSASKLIKKKKEHLDSLLILSTHMH